VTQAAGILRASVRRGRRTPRRKGFAPPQSIVDMYTNRKKIEEPIVSSHGDATRFFVTFLDNHDNKARFYFVDPAAPTACDDQTTAALACLYGLQGIPCLYYGTEQKLHGAGSDELVRESLWAEVPNPPVPFDPTNPFYVAIQNIARVRAAQPALRYGRQYFRQISGDGVTFGVSPFNVGVVAYSRVLNDEEVVVLVNVSTTPVDVFVVVDSSLNPSATTFRVLFSNKAGPKSPDPVRTFGAGRTLTVHGLDGNVCQLRSPGRRVEGARQIDIGRRSIQPAEVGALAYPDQIPRLQVGLRAMEEPPYAGGLTLAAGPPVDHALSMTCRAWMGHDEGDWAGGDRVRSKVFVGWHRFAPLAGGNFVRHFTTPPGTPWLLTRPR
jgi:hypothetical protein